MAPVSVYRCTRVPSHDGYGLNVRAFLSQPSTLFDREPPEAVCIDTGGEGYPGRVSCVAYLGPTVEYEVEVTWAVLVLTQYDPGKVYPVGAEAHEQLVKEALYLLPKA
jgi:hypothetical protein